MILFDTTSPPFSVLPWWMRTPGTNLLCLLAKEVCHCPLHPFMLEQRTWPLWMAVTPLPSPYMPWTTLLWPCLRPLRTSMLGPLRPHCMLRISPTCRHPWFRGNSLLVLSRLSWAKYSRMLHWKREPGSAPWVCQVLLLGLWHPRTRGNITGCTPRHSCATFDTAWGYWYTLMEQGALCAWNLWISWATMLSSVAEAGTVVGATILSVTALPSMPIRAPWWPRWRPWD